VAVGCFFCGKEEGRKAFGGQKNRRSAVFSGPYVGREVTNNYSETEGLLELEEGEFRLAFAKGVSRADIKPL